MAWVLCSSTRVIMHVLPRLPGYQANVVRGCNGEVSGAQFFLEINANVLQDVDAISIFPIDASGMPWCVRSRRRGLSVWTDAYFSSKLDIEGLARNRKTPKSHKALYPSRSRSSVGHSICQLLKCHCIKKIVDTYMYLFALESCNRYRPITRYGSGKLIYMVQCTIVYQRHIVW